MTLDWQRTYPTLATVAVAGFETLCAWCGNLPAPQTDVERTVLRRLKARRDAMAAERIRKEAPAIANKFNEIIDRLERAGIHPPVRRM